MESILILTSDFDRIQGVKDFFQDNKIIVSQDLKEFEKNLHSNSLKGVLFDAKFVSENYEDPAKFLSLIQGFMLPFPHMPYIVFGEISLIRLMVDAVKAGAWDYVSVPLVGGEFSLVWGRALESKRSKSELQYLRKESWNQELSPFLRTKSPALNKVFESIRDVASTKTTVLLGGETGVGKSEIAKLIHRKSSRSNAPFVHVHCGAIPENLFESEIFGHEKGAFTGAVKRKLGKFEVSNRGTIFFDEISTLSPSAQIKLLKVLQDSCFERVGGEQEIKVDVRVIAATNDSLLELVERGEFRKDLYYRINVFPIELPSLKDRLEDLPYLLDYFLMQLNREGCKIIEGCQPELLEMLSEYPWPGNIRELQNLVERAFVLEKGRVLSAESFPAEVLGENDVSAILPLNLELSLSDARAKVLEGFERQYMKTIMTKFEGKIGAAAEAAGVTVRQIHNLLKRHSIDKADYKNIKLSE